MIDIDPSDTEFRDLQRFDEFKRVFLKNGKDAYDVGEVFKQSDLAKTLKLIAKKGAKEFYQGSIAKKIVADLSAHDGMLSLADFKNHKANWVDPFM